MEYKAAHGIGTLDDEKYRLIFVGVPCYPIFRRFNEMFTEWGGAFVSSTYLWFASGGANLGFEYDLGAPAREPRRRRADRRARTRWTACSSRTARSSTMVDPFRVDGVVYHPIKSCRTVSTGLADSRRVADGRSATSPSLFIESDMMDRRVVSEAQLKNRIDAFFEGLATPARQPRQGSP